MDTKGKRIKLLVVVEAIFVLIFCGIGILLVRNYPDYVKCLFLALGILVLMLNVIFVAKKFFSCSKKDIEFTFIAGAMFIAVFIGGAVACRLNSTSTTFYQVDIFDKDGNSIYSDILKNDMQPAINFFDANSEDGSKMIITRETIQN